MQRDFTLKTYRQLLVKLKSHDYKISTCENYMKNHYKDKQIAMLRHDVDKRPQNALKMAHLESEIGIKSTYYFRIVRQSNDPDIIMQIAGLGHEIGYHYEDLTLSKGNYELAITNFKENLNYFRSFYPVQTICMHGSPLTQWDNKDIWNEIDYKDYGIIGEPYFDIDYQNVAYLTDTGRKWNALNENIRDKVESAFTFDFKSTFDVMDALNTMVLPNIILISTHPQRWTNSKIFWLSELIMQRSKNIIKRLI